MARARIKGVGLTKGTKKRRRNQKDEAARRRRPLRRPPPGRVRPQNRDRGPVARNRKTRNFTKTT